MVLNACYSEEQARAIAKSIPFVIGTTSAIPDEGAKKFSELFYYALGSGRSLHEAFLEGKKAQDNFAGRGSPEMFQCWPTDGGDGGRFVPAPEEDPLPPAVRQRLGQFYGKFQVEKRKIDDLQQTKKLHDALQALNGQSRVIEGLAPVLTNNGALWNIVEPFIRTMIGLIGTAETATTESSRAVDGSLLKYIGMKLSKTKILWEVSLAKHQTEDLEMAVSNVSGLQLNEVPSLTNLLTSNSKRLLIDEVITDLRMIKSDLEAAHREPAFAAQAADYADQFQTAWGQINTLFELHSSLQMLDHKLRNIVASSDWKKLVASDWDWLKDEIPTIAKVAPTVPLQALMDALFRDVFQSENSTNKSLRDLADQLETAFKSTDEDLLAKCSALGSVGDMLAGILIRSSRKLA